jgi:hypothetical protein
MKKNKVSVLYTAIVTIMRPIVRMALKRGISYETFSSLIKWVFYEVAKNDLIIEGKKQTQSRISVLTGFSRKEVKRLSEVKPPMNQNQLEQCNRGARVISGWRRETKYVDGKGEPVAIPIYGKGATFEKLVKKFSGDMPTRAVMDELIRIGAIKLEPDQRVRLIKDAFIPTHDDAIKFHIFGTDVSLLISTIENNIELKSEEPFFQRKVYYDNLPDEVIADLRRMSKKSAQKLINDMDRYIAINDRDVNPKLEGTGRNIAGIGLYYFEKPYKEP